MPYTPMTDEDAISKIPALQLLQNLDYTYLTPDEALAMRGGKLGNVILEGVLADWLRANNSIQSKGQEYPFSEGNILTAIQSLKDVAYDGLVRTNEKVYDLLCLGRSLEQAINGDTKSFSLQYIDWERPERNWYHVAEEFPVERSGMKDAYVPDIVLFVNGIPLAVIECKRPDLGVGKDPIAQAISQHIRNQKQDGIPHLFLYSQLLMAVSKNEAKYATTGTPMEFWAVWKEEGIDGEVESAIRKPLSKDQNDKLFETRAPYVKQHFQKMEEEGGREVTDQDRAIYALCRPERLLRLAYRYVVYDDGAKKIARYQQFFTVDRIMERVSVPGEDNTRRGGVVWHTQGSGKSLTMVMLAKAIALEKKIKGPKIILVTDRIDLDDQIYNNFRHCGLDPVRAKTGRDLLQKLLDPKAEIITTVIDKFDAAVSTPGVKPFDRVLDENIFVLVDEGHRGQYGPRHARMRKVMPLACYIAFTGTPVMRKDRNTVEQFGGLIQPTYTIRKATDDKAVLELIYEGRHVPQKVDADSIDGWFDKITMGLSKDQVADLKRKFATTDQLNKAAQKVRMVAWDISLHYSQNWQGTPFKGQLVAPDKTTALLYKQCLDECGMVTSDLLISGPDEREGEDDIYAQNKDAVIRFWKAMMEKYGSEREYNKQIINGFKNSDTPEIIIVVDKLLTGFDEPRDTILYLTRKLKEHNLLQAIARVNRIHEGKDYGYIIDYRGVLEELDQAMDLYEALADFDESDLQGTWIDSHAIVQTLPQKHSVLWDLFKPIRNTRDEEAYERLLADEALRVKFYERYSDFARTLAIALSTVRFIEETPQAKIAEYQRDLKFFGNLRTAVKRRYAEVVDFSQYEPKIQKLIDTYVGTGEVEQITPPVNIFDTEKFAAEVAKLGGDAAKADTIAHRTLKAMDVHMAEDPTFYRKFSEMLLEAINAFRQARIQEAEYLKRVRDIMSAVITRTGDDLPDSLKNEDGTVKAFFGPARETLAKYAAAGLDPLDGAAEIALGIRDAITRLIIVDWVTNIDRQNEMRNAIEDFLFEFKEKHSVDMSFEDIDSIMEQCLNIARARLRNAR